MYKTKLYILLIISVILTSCQTQKNRTDFKINIENTTLSLGDTLNIGIDNPKNINIKAVNYLLDGTTITPQWVLKNTKLGKKNLKAVISYNDKTDTITQKITVFNNTKPEVYTYKIINTYPHDISSYTQGLEFYNDTLYEGTGQKGASKLRKIDFKTGKVLKNLDLANTYFGEGITILNQNIYQLTWRAKVGFVYNVNTFKKQHTFTFNKSLEGWGLCNNGNVLFKSDGTEKIWTLNAKTQQEESYIEVYTNKGKIPSLNELEWVNGKIYANIYQRNGVAIINPNTGAVDGVINFKPLKKLVKQHDNLDVLNGIAYNKARGTLFVTGKNWDKLFEVKIQKK